MSFIVQGPFPLMQTTLLLRSPELTNTRKLTASVQTMRSMNGTLYTYVKSKRGRKVHTWDFISSRDKMLETKSFVEQYSGGLVQVVDHESTRRIGYLTMNPLDSGGEGRAEGWPSGEAYRFSLQLEEKV